MYSIKFGDYQSNHRTAKAAAAALNREIRAWGGGRFAPPSSIARDGFEIEWNHLAALARAETSGRQDADLLRYERLAAALQGALGLAPRTPADARSEPAGDGRADELADALLEVQKSWAARWGI